MKSKTNPTDRATAETFQALGLKWPTHVFEEVRAAYRRRCMETHPDQGGDAAAFRAVREAWALLDTPEKVSEAFDRWAGFEPVDPATARRVAADAPTFDPASRYDGRTRGPDRPMGRTMPWISTEEIPAGSVCYRPPSYSISSASGRTIFSAPCVWATPAGGTYAGPSPEEVRAARPGFAFEVEDLVRAA